MEKTVRNLRICNIVLLVAVVVLFVLHFAGNGKQVAPVEVKEGVVADGAFKVAYINTDSLNAKYQYVTDLTKDLNGQLESKENNLKRQAEKLQNDADQLQKEYANYLQTGDKLTLDQQKAKEADFKKREEDINQRMEKLAALRQDYAVQLQQKQLVENDKMVSEILEFIKNYNDNHQQFNLILAKSGVASPVLYGDDAMDITNEIIDALNKDYEANKANKQK